MYALTLAGTHHAPSVRLIETSPPAEESGRILVRVSAAGITRMEPHWITGWEMPDGSERSQPAIMGHEFAGTVLHVAPGYDVGDRVMGFIEPEREGAMAEVVSAAPSQIMRIPDEISDEVASTLSLAGLTAFQAMVRYGRLEAGQRVLIHGGAGAVGNVAVQIARWIGAEVIATATAEDRELCQRLGADRVIDFERERFEDVVQDVDLVFDPIGGQTQERSWSVLRRGGRLITIAGEQSDAPDQERARRLGVEARWFLIEMNLTELRQLSELVVSGTVRPVISETFRLANGADAFDPARPPKAGKAVLLCS